MENIDIYNNSRVILNKKMPKIITSWLTILIILLILLIIFCNIKFNIYKNLKGIVIIKDNDTFIQTILNKSDFELSKKDLLYIKDKKYKYEIINIENNIALLKIDIPDDLKIEDNVININILKERTTLFKIIKRKIKERIDVWEI